MDLYLKNSNQQTEKVLTYNNLTPINENTDLMLGKLLIFMKYSKSNQKKSRFCQNIDFNKKHNMNHINMCSQNKQKKQFSKISSLSLLSAFLVDQNKNIKDQCAKKIPTQNQNSNLNENINCTKTKQFDQSTQNKNTPRRERQRKILKENKFFLINKKLNGKTKKKISKHDLKLVLNQKPKLSWGERLYYLKQYDNNLVQGHPEIFYTKNFPIADKKDKILIVNKTIFPLILNLTKSITKNANYNLYQNAYKSCQRGLIEWFRRKNYQNKTMYSREKMEFHPNSFR
ncbi:hypothetical protein M0813_25144 [Anaeramoeba flamelloides]|uniref:Uncharacterized protein n=1 Tax=Anaeramoeba flamelloides TaxID=1746091 RepID=A0ABQ8Y353_9EUKA|nr:hypothetical protein M0813_25144 [Anaeramoeba flamelloides]